MFGTLIPVYLCHRLVVASAIETVKDIIINGDIAKVESSFLQESWTNLTDVLLERTVIHTVYERDFAEIDSMTPCANISHIFPLD